MIDKIKDLIVEEPEKLKNISDDLKRPEKIVPEPGKNGGARPGAGRKKGGENKKTKDDKVVQEAFRQRVLKSMGSLIDSQMALAKGVQMLFRIKTVRFIDPKSGVKKVEKKKPELVEDSTTIADYLAGDYDDDDDVYYFMTTAKPDNKALDSLIDRVFGKATNNLKVDGDIKMSSILDEIKPKLDGDE